MKLCIHTEGCSTFSGWIVKLSELPEGCIWKGDLYLIEEGCLSKEKSHDGGMLTSYPPRGYFLGKIVVEKAEKSVSLYMNGVSMKNRDTDVLSALEFDYDMFESLFEDTVTVDMVIASARNVEKHFHHTDEYEVWKVLEMYQEHYKGKGLMSGERKAEFRYATCLDFENSAYGFALVLNPHAKRLRYRSEAFPYF